MLTKIANFGGLKDKGVSLAARTAANVYLKTKGYGEMFKLDLDSTKKLWRRELCSKGRKSPSK